MKLFDESKPFYKGNLHTHTTNSDGRKAPQEVIELYKANGYDFLALTDHWKRTVETPYYFEGMLMLPGIELDYTWFNQVIHVLGINVDETILERVDRRHTAQRGIMDIRAAGGRAILAHPAWSLNTNEVLCGLRGLTAAEVYNTVSGAPWNGDRADALLPLDIAAANGTLINTVASDDAHFYTGEACAAFTMIQADELTPEALCAALDKGAFYASRGPRFEQIEVEGDEIYVRCSPVSQILFHSNLPWVSGRCRRGEGLTENVYKIERDRGEQFVRVVLRDENGLPAWSNPIPVK